MCEGVNFEKFKKYGKHKIKLNNIQEKLNKIKYEGENDKICFFLKIL